MLRRANFIGVFLSTKKYSENQDDRATAVNAKTISDRIKFTRVSAFWRFKVGSISSEFALDCRFRAAEGGVRAAIG